MGALADVGHADAGKGGDEGQQRQGRARTAAAQTRAARGCLVERNTREVIGGKLLT
jgi:hypothetical protein